jgi:hypothetical protein
VIYAVYRHTGELYDVMITKAEAQQTQQRVNGSFIQEYNKPDDVLKHCPPQKNN